MPGVARALRGFSIFFGSVPVFDVGVLDALAGRLIIADFGRGGRLLSDDSNKKEKIIRIEIVLF